MVGESRKMNRLTLITIMVFRKTVTRLVWKNPETLQTLPKKVTSRVIGARIMPSIHNGPDVIDVSRYCNIASSTS